MEAQRHPEVYREAAQTLAFLMRITEAMLEPADEIAATIPHDETYDKRVKGLEQMKRGVAMVFDGAERSLHETDHYQPAELSLLLDAMAATVPSAKRWFPVGSVKELNGRLKADRKTFQGEQDRQNIDRMIAALES